MIIEPINGGRLRVWLNQREVRRCRLDREHCDRRAVRRLVRHVLTQGGYEPSKGTVAEMIPVADGWVLLVSPHTARSDSAAVYWFEDEQALSAFLSRWEGMERAPSCALYRLEDGYALTVHGDDPLTPHGSGLLEEYARLWGRGEPLSAHVAEYGQLLQAGYLTADGPRPPAEQGYGN